MKALDQGTEQRIIQAARQVFIRKGYDGARMQEIADEAGMNKALLHYYFRSKDQLFEIVFREAFLSFIPLISKGILGKMPWEQKVQGLVENYMSFLLANPFLPQFILHEAGRNPERIKNILVDMGMNPELLISELGIPISKEWPEITDFRHILVNLLAMCIFPVVAGPLIQLIFFEGDKEAYTSFLKERKDVIPQFFFRGGKDASNQHDI